MSAVLALRPTIEYTLPVKQSWLSRSFVVVPVKVRRAFCLLAVLFILLITFAPALWTVTWHVVHGNSMIYKTKRVPVPLRWTAKSEPQGADVERLPLTIFYFDKPVQAIISLRVMPPAKSQTGRETSESFEAAYWTYLAGDRVVTGPVRVLPGPDEGVCMEATAKDASEGLNIECLVFQDRWMVSFWGIKKERSEFYKILGEIR
jgi:hypothetical protein